MAVARRRKIPLIVTAAGEQGASARILTPIRVSLAIIAQHPLRIKFRSESSLYCSESSLYSCRCSRCSPVVHLELQYHQIPARMLS